MLIIPVMIVMTVQGYLTEILPQTNVEHVITIPLTTVYKMLVAFGAEITPLAQVVQT